jgi:hypothetical protein
MHVSGLILTETETMSNVIAERKLLYSMKDSSDRKELVIRIGAPYVDKEGMARCPIEWNGLFEEYADMAGMDSLQALQLAANVDSMLGKLRNKYDFFWASGEPYFEDAQ